jgi:hypothetical protein
MIVFTEGYKEINDSVTITFGLFDDIEPILTRIVMFRYW